jgi:uncharacterized C2H2 Zn-finger protein
VLQVRVDLPVSPAPARPDVLRDAKRLRVSRTLLGEEVTSVTPKTCPNCGKPFLVERLYERHIKKCKGR